MIKIPYNIHLMDSGNFYPLIGVLASLLWLYFSFSYFLYYRGLIASGLGDLDKNVRFLRWAQVFMLVSGLVFTAALIDLFNLPRASISPQTTATATLAQGEGLGQPLSTPGPTLPIVPTSIPLISPTPEAVPGSGTASIGNTNGFGVFVRAEPGLKYEMLAQLSDGSRVELTGEAQSADGFTWQRVRLEDGRVGWIADKFLIPEP